MASRVFMHLLNTHLAYDTRSLTTRSRSISSVIKNKQHVSKSIYTSRLPVKTQSDSFSTFKLVVPCHGVRVEKSALTLCRGSHQTSQASNTNPDRSFTSTTGSLKNCDTTKILYDSECRICAVEISGLKRWTRNKTDVEFIDITSLDYDPQNFHGVTYEDAMREMHVIGSDGKVYTQGDAIRVMYRACGFGWLATFTEMPGLRPVFDRLYMKFAEYRLRKALEKCDSGSCSIKLHNLREKLNKH